ncbi:N-acetyltransferase family protein [Mycobacterium sp. Lab-001]|uniref:GNAT family N-acetyltransferase n=1 Tax=Mycobacterium sp. Lab-001 TaxID=3410136 RepID=UPI003D175233
MNNSGTTIREATPSDFTRVADMHYPAWRRSWAGILTAPLLDILGPARRWAADIYPQNLGRPGWSMWVAESGDRVVGVTILGPDTADPDHLQIDALYIDEDCQRRGLGGHLLDTALSALPPADAVLWCAERNGKARRFYEKKDFRLDGRTLDWEPLPGVRVPHVGYTLRRR